jgi:sorbitol-specific phosphotransferase system component IIA
MKKLKSFALVVIGLLCCGSVSAHYFEVDGIFYNITSEADKTVEVTFQGQYGSSYSNEYSGSVTIPSSVNYNESTYSVTTIGEETFYDCSSLVHVTIPNSVTTVGSRAFFGCSSLTEIIFPNSVTTIGNQTFAYCSSLMHITFSNSVTTIGESAFMDCLSLTHITIPSSVTTIGKQVFTD